MVTFLRRFVVWNLEGVSIFCGISLVENRRQVWKRPTNSQEREKRRLVELEINLQLLSISQTVKKSTNNILIIT